MPAVPLRWGCNMSDPKRRVVVRGPNILAPPLLDTNDAHTIEFRDGDGRLVALFMRVLGESGLWGFSTIQDEDWPQTLVRNGYTDEL